MRISERAREAVVRQLGADCARGYLSLDTFAWRVERAFAARTSDELAGLRADLPPAGPFSALVERLSLWVSRRRHAACVACSPPARLGEPYLIGRAPDCDLVLSDQAVSRRHAELRLIDGRWLISDLASLNGTHVNGWAVLEAHVVDGDELVLGRTRLRFHAPAAT
jgi:hypothetical protein